MTVEFDPTTYTVSESDSFANITVVKHGPPPQQAVSVNFATIYGSAIGKDSRSVYEIMCMLYPSYCQSPVSQC